MARKIAAPSSRTRRRRGRRYPTPREWLGGIQFSGFAAILLLLVVFGVIVLVPTVRSYVQIRQQIAQAQQGITIVDLKADVVAGYHQRRWDLQLIVRDVAV